MNKKYKGYGAPVTLHNLKGVAKPHIETQIVQNISSGMELLKTRRAFTMAGDHGAITAWIDDKGQYHCAFSQYQITKGYVVVPSKANLREWLKEWFDLMHNTSKESDNA